MDQKKEIIEKAKEIGFSETKDGLLFINRKGKKIWLDLRHAQPRMYAYENGELTDDFENIKEIQQIRSFMESKRSKRLDYFM